MLTSWRFDNLIIRLVKFKVEFTKFENLRLIFAISDSPPKATAVRRLEEQNGTVHERFQGLCASERRGIWKMPNFRLHNIFFKSFLCFSQLAYFKWVYQIAVRNENSRFQWISGSRPNRSRFLRCFCHPTSVCQRGCLLHYEGREIFNEWTRQNFWI